MPDSLRQRSARRRCRRWAALDYLQANAERLQIDPDRITIAGDSAGAHIAAQPGALVTNARLRRHGRRDSHITAAQLRGLVLASGPYDLRLARDASSPDDHRPPLGREYQFDLDTDAVRQFRERLLAFLQQRLGPHATAR